MKMYEFEAQSLKDVEMANVLGGKRPAMVCACCCVGNPETGEENTESGVAAHTA